jgi:ubiquinone/menaquinone biosynthesis C-methylase UbiE
MQIEINRTEQATFDYVEGLKRYIAEKSMPKLRADYEMREELYAQKHDGKKPATIEEVSKLMLPLPVYRFNRAIQQASQALMWKVIYEALEPRRAELTEELNGPTENALGSIEIDPDLELPKYYTSFEFHLQPRSYHGDELAGVVYDIGVPIYVLHRNGPDSGESGRALASVIPPGRYERILDMGCGVGQKTLPIAFHLPGAEVHAIDLSAPMLKYAHKRAERFGYRIHFSQQNAERTNFAAESFDLVVSTILMHELPLSAIRNMIGEIHRLLKPGGLTAHLNLPPYSKMSPYNAFLSDWEMRNNCEPYWHAFHSLDLPKLFREVGFKNISQVEAESKNTGRGAYSGKSPYLVTIAEK